MLRRRLNSLLLGMNKIKKTAAQPKKKYSTVLSSSGNCSSRRMDTPERAEQATMQKIAEQVQAETHQWSQMQEILHNVYEEVEDLQKSKDFWEDHALHADAKIAILQMHEWRQKALFCENKVLNLQSEVTQLRNAVEQAKETHAVEQTIWVDAHTRSTRAVIPLISARSSKACTIDSENLEHHEAYVDAMEMSNQSGEKEKVDHRTKNGKDETKDSWHVLMGSPLMRTERTSLRICKPTQSFHVSSHHQSLINKDSKLSRPESCSQTSAMHSWQNDCNAKQLSEEKFMKEIHICNSRKDITG